MKTAGLFSRGMKVFLPGCAVSGGSGSWVLRIWGLGEPLALMYTPGVGASSIASGIYVERPGRLPRNSRRVNTLCAASKVRAAAVGIWGRISVAMPE